MNSNGVTAVMPGTMRARSTPARMKMGQSVSANIGATTSHAIDVRGAKRFEARPTATWPRNMAWLRLPAATVRRVVLEVVGKVPERRERGRRGHLDEAAVALAAREGGDLLDLRAVVAR